MANGRDKRRLAAILAADVVGYSRLMGVDESGTRAALRTHRAEVLDPKITDHDGRIVGTAGDSVLAEFGSVVNAVRCAAEIQRAMAARNQDVPEDKRIRFRIGVNVGDVIVEGGDIHGDGVNIAARLEGLCEPGEVYVSGTVYDQAAGKLSVSFEDLGEHTVKNIANPIRVYSVRAKSMVPTLRGDDGEALWLPSKPSIVVLPFTNMSGDPEQEYFSDGITEDIITALSRFRSLFVIARNSSFTYKDRAVDVKQISAELDVRYLLEGSVRKAGTRVRITAQLVEGTAGAHLWAERYDRDLDDIFAVQDEITETIVGAIEPELGSSERKRARRKPPERLDAWESYQRGMSQFYQYTPNSRAEARRFFSRAIELDPNFGSAYAALAINDHWVYNMGDPGSSERPAEMLGMAKRAVALDERDPLAHVALGLAYSLHGDHENAIAAMSAAIDLNPSDAEAYDGLAFVLIGAGRYEETLAAVETAMRLSPHAPNLGLPLNLRALCLVMLNRYEEAVKSARRAIRVFDARTSSSVVSDLSPSDDIHTTPFWAYAHLASALGHLGRGTEAKAALDQMLRRKPDFSRDFIIQGNPSKPADWDIWFEGLRKAGWQDDAPTSVLG
ncbi:MAG: adenylate/guanylate cyclase domain-containing protein [Gemmatimonadales bacterium]